MDDKQKPIVADFLSLLVEKAADFFDKKKIFELIAKENFESGIFGVKNSVRKDSALLADQEGLKQKITALISLLAGTLGATAAERLVEEAYTRLERRYTPALANQHLIPLIPAGFMEKYRLSILSKEELQAMVVEKTKANEELKALDKRKTEFLSVVAHQLRTPLSGLKWGLDLMTKGGYGPISDQQKDFSAKAYKEIEHMIQLVEDMLAANKIEFSAFELKPAENDLVEVIEEAIAENQESAAQSGIALSFNKPAQPIPKFSFDREKVLDVFDNLIDNGVKYNKAGGKVEVEASFADGAVNCIIRDNGIGIPAAGQKELFSRFFRAANAKTVDPNGNGLGLYIAKSIVELHGGTIRFESEENKGTTFFITFKTNK